MSKNNSENVSDALRKSIERSKRASTFTVNATQHAMDAVRLCVVAEALKNTDS